jgi:hypothetical protein
MKISNALKLLKTNPTELATTLEQDYSGEYLYGNKLLQTLAEYHPVPSVLCELSTAGSRADMITLISGEAHAWEIKTENDSLTRLKSQLKSYRQVFPYVYVLVHEKHLPAVRKELPNTTGIAVFKDSKIYFHRHSREDLSDFNFKSAANILRKEELRSVIRRRFGDVPDVSDFDFRTVYTSMFALLTKETAATEVAEALAARCLRKYDDLKSVPENLKLAVLASNLKKIPSF